MSLMKPSGIGGMAVLEGVMMRNKNEYAIAVRKPNNEIAVEKQVHKDFSEKVRLFKLPIFRGMLAFVDSTVMGVKVLNYAASFLEDEETVESEKDKKSEKKSDKNKANKNNRNNVKQSTKNDKKQKKNSLKVQEGSMEEISATEEKGNGSDALLMVAAVFISIIFSVGLFMVLPLLISSVFAKLIDSDMWLSILEAILRIVIFIGYILLISQMSDIKRVFMYHGAEHKTINCLENGFELTVENVRWQTKQHKRCGTSFMLIVMLISAVFFMVIRPETLLLRVVSRILLVPIIAGLSYEFIRLAGKSESKLVDILSKPGLWMQGLTTKEPDDSMIEVAIQSVEAVFDWRAFLETTTTSKEADKKSAVGKRSNKSSNKSGRGGQSNRQPIRNTSLNDMPKTEDNEKSVRKDIDEVDDILNALDKYLDFEDDNVER